MSENNQGDNRVHNGDMRDDEHILHMPEIFGFKTKEGYDYLHRGLIKTPVYFFTRTAAHLILNLFDRVAFGYKVRGIENLFKVHGGAIVTPNHVHEMDCTFVDCAIPVRRMYYTTLESNFKIPIARHLMRILGGIPIPTHPRSIKEFEENIRTALKKGSFVCMYPEAAMHPYCNRLRGFKNGAFRISCETGCPIVPITITYRDPSGLYRLYKKKPCMTLTILPPVYPPQGDNIRQMADEMMQQCYDTMNAKISVDNKKAAVEVGSK